MRIRIVEVGRYTRLLLGEDGTHFATGEHETTGWRSPERRAADWHAGRGVEMASETKAAYTVGCRVGVMVAH
jgi:hypothetical protein